MSQPQPGFLVSPELLGKIRSTVSVVEDAVTPSKPWRIPVRLEEEDSRSPKVFRIAEFTGAWAIDSTKTVTLKYQTTTPNTVVVTNLFVENPPDGPVAIAKEGTAWYAVEFQRDSDSPFFRIAEFTGAWPKGTSKTVEYKYNNPTEETVSVLNLFADVPAPPGTGDCAIGREGTAWFLIAAECIIEEEE